MKQLVKTVIVIVAMSAALYSCSDEQEAVKIPPRQEAQPKPQEPLEELPEMPKPQEPFNPSNQKDTPDAPSKTKDLSIAPQGENEK